MIDLGIIIEPRNNKLLITVIKNLIEKIPFLKIHIFHGNLNENLIKKNLSNYITENKIILTNLNVNNISIYEYNNILTNKNFWENIKEENILIFQIDSLVCNFNTKLFKHLNNYGFVGAPCKPWTIPWQNGGLSLRKKSLMIKAIYDKKENENFFPEDRYFTVIKKQIVNPAPFKLAKQFSVEKYYFDKPFGIHKPWLYLNNNEMKNQKASMDNFLQSRKSKGPKNIRTQDFENEFRIIREEEFWDAYDDYYRSMSDSEEENKEEDYRAIDQDRYEHIFDDKQKKPVDLQSLKQDYFFL